MKVLVSSRHVDSGKGDCEAGRVVSAIGAITDVSVEQRRSSDQLELAIAAVPRRVPEFQKSTAQFRV